MYKFFIYSILLIDLCFFYLVPLPGAMGSIINNYQKIGLSTFIIVFTLLTAKKIYKDNNYLFTREIFIYVILILGELILSFLNYEQGVKSILASSNHYFILIAYFFIVYSSFTEGKSVEDLEIMIIKIVLILSSILVVQYLVFLLSGKLFLNIDKARALSSIRFGSIRIYEGSYLPTVGSVVSFGVLIKKNTMLKDKRIALSCIVMSTIHLLFISKGRMPLIMIILSFGFITIIYNKRNRFRKYFMILIFVFIVIIFSRLPIVNNFIASINSNDYSLITRSEAMQFYSNQIKENLFFGMGFIEAIPGDISYNIVRGPKGMFYKDDMGILGFFNIFGIFGVILYWFIIVKIIRILTIVKRRKLEKKYIEVYGLVFYIIIGSIFMSPFDSQRIIVMPLLLSIIDVLYREVKRVDTIKN